MKNSMFPATVLTATFSGLVIVLSALQLPARAADMPLTDNPAYQKNCAKCHGKTAEGRHFGGPSLMSDKVHSASESELTGIVTNGKGRMPKYADKLSDADIKTLVEQIESLK